MTTAYADDQSKTERLRLLGLTDSAGAVLVPAMMSCWLPLSSVRSMPATFRCLRYALERWKSDAYEVIVFHDHPLNTEQTDVSANDSVHASTMAGGSANINVVQSPIGASQTAAIADLWNSIQAATDRHIAVRCDSNQVSRPNHQLLARARSARQLKQIC